MNLLNSFLNSMRLLWGKFLNQIIKSWGNKKIFLYVSQASLLGFVFLFPFNIKSLVFTEDIFGGGNFNFYTSIFLYLNDLFLLLSFFSFSLYRFWSREKLHWGFVPLSLAAVVLLMAINVHSLLLAADLQLAYFVMFRWLSFGVFVFLGMQRILKVETLVLVFLGSMVTQSMIGIVQYVIQGSVGLSFLGEALIGPDVPGVAKFDFNGRKVMRAYGLFLHSNIFAGGLFVAVGLIVGRLKKNPWLMTPFLVVVVSAMILTFSRSAWLAVLVGGMVWYALQEGQLKLSWKYLFLGLSVALFVVISFDLEGVLWERIFGSGGSAGVERSLYFHSGKEMLLSSPMGVGLGHFTIEMPKKTMEVLYPWLVQPVHNVFLLVANELGVIIFGGLVSLLGGICVWLYSRKEEILLSMVLGIVTISLFDHYFYTLYAGQFLIAFMFLLISLRLSSKD